MSAALALLVLLAGFVFIVRIASVFLRLTGLPNDVARFQSVSALTGAGFTTTESETIVNFPARRRVIVTLMALGNLGIVSVASTFIVALTGSRDSGTELLQQIGLLIGVTVLIAVFMVNKTFDRILCALIERLMRRLLQFGREPYDVLLEFPNRISIARHYNRGEQPVSIAVRDLGGYGLTLLNVGDAVTSSGANADGRISLASGESMICLGAPDAHSALGAYLNPRD